MSSFKLFLEESRKWNLKTAILRGLAAEAIKAPSLKDFYQDYQIQIKHGLYWHWTDDPNFQIDPNKGPRDMSSLATGGVDVGKFMITSHLANWSSYGNRQYVALIDMTQVPRNQYFQSSRGFGNEFFVNDPSKARVIKVYGRKAAQDFDRSQNKYLPRSNDELADFYNFVKGTNEQF
jgi:hypothetical protein